MQSCLDKNVKVQAAGSCWMKNNRTFFLKILSTVPIFIFVDNINVTMSLICTSVVQINSTETTFLTLSVYDFVTGFDLQSKVPKRAELCKDKQTPFYRIFWSVQTKDAFYIIFSSLCLWFCLPAHPYSFVSPVDI